MTRNRKFVVTALLAATTAVGTLPGDAAATTLLDLLRGGPGRQAKQQAAPASLESQARGGLEMGDPEPLPKVAGPRYYTYKPEAQRAIKIKLPVTDAAAGSTEAPSAEVLGARRFLSDVSVRATDEVAKTVEGYYGDPNKPLIWTSEDGISERGRAMISALAGADTVGLSPDDYLVAMPTENADPADPEKRQRELMAFEVALSAKVLTYVQDTVRGRIDPNKISGYYDFKRKGVNIAPVLDMLRKSPDVAAYLRNRDPKSPQFVALRDELMRLKAEDAEAETQAITIAPGTLLKPGQSKPETAQVIGALKQVASEAVLTQHSATLTAYTGTPDYTPELVAVVEQFQEEKGLKPDGVVGPATIRAMTGHSNAEKIAKLEVAMEALRWLPADLGSRYVFINAPAFEATYVNDGKEQFSMRVVVGSKANQTYFFQDQIQTVEFNPYWGVPKSIIVNEMLPKLRADPSYLDRLGYEVSYGGRKVASSQVNWNATHAVDVRQPPGGDNALGELKILFPNEHAIYMHDTPSKSYFNRDMRALSHGCVRLAEPRVMAAAVMGTTVEEIGKQIASGQNRAVQVPQKLPVYVSYFTAWPNKDGVIEYFDDVYSRDDHTAKAFKATTDARAPRV
ncbi:peptidoglycan-binding protein [Rhizobium rosettiformans]|uniref:Peptidoglycan-binding protein n=1 Tax=Rhizobium rosettiformans TaxID=1368430 RepID=A0ABX7F0U6_9HYPH|nr:L,D-transpeptidase family protein [Rhizobium rosettiformans]QRF53312.1 peptidoglycan-binding protein [Rhizobium rosettiformans]